MSVELAKIDSKQIAVNNAAVRCQKLTKEFRAGETIVRALRGVDVEIAYGEMTLLVGPSGCGKTTLISIIAGLLDPTDGEVEVLGENRRELTGTRLVKFRQKNIGFVFQQYNLLPALDVVENVSIPLIIGGVSQSDAKMRAAEVLKKVSLEDKINARVSQLSGGQQQRVAIARALVHDPRLMVCDEPTAALDAASGHNIMELLREVSIDQDRVVIVVTHDNRVFDFGDRVIEMADGVVENVTTNQRSRNNGGSNTKVKQT
ncbi:ABC transporter ATP-binding protein [Rubinisphaera sp.]|uniref:ABC transporter ATP-binding protein n=1 Tax=Rubinisphaera sp. TaxID=2024857 RepID=UPI000C0E60FA|nr:ABC transporter ATP-binding protein [Rubinisphaera sp.]MBV10138.1 ABC transporter ATP-binding protein [Rubinisphaera sp.]HCS50981.1 ABC transporter ATP-binding protein [Planctomycetaceae bacterium]|tara:strand:+ start:163 stop:942 length:780 start_codon:yes stop_codon:yes gene_type:complete